jgi:hypothetical protein
MTFFFFDVFLDKTRDDDERRKSIDKNSSLLFFSFSSKTHFFSIKNNKSTKVKHKTHHRIFCR